MTSPTTGDRPTGKTPRRAVRRAGTVGTDDAVLVSTLPAFPTEEPRATTEDPTATTGNRRATTANLTGNPIASPTGSATSSSGTPDPAVAVRSADDSDVGWGGSDDSNDDRLHRDKPPHW